MSCTVVLTSLCCNWMKTAGYRTCDMFHFAVACFQIVVTIISGIPGSHQEKLVNVLSDLSKDQNR